jgi:hypothetical protein
MPLITELHQVTRAVAPRRAARADPALRPLPGDLFKNARRADDLRAIVVRCERCLDDVLGKSVCHDLVTGAGDRLDGIGGALCEHTAHHHVAAQLDAIERAQQPLDAAHRTVMRPQQRVGV